jgi:DNA-binding response OmpR family regulator
MSSGRGRQRAAVRIDARDERAWLGDAALDLTPRAFAVLRRLVERAGRLVT